MVCAHQTSPCGYRVCSIYQSLPMIVGSLVRELPEQRLWSEWESNLTSTVFQTAANWPTALSLRFDSSESLILSSPETITGILNVSQIYLYLSWCLSQVSVFPLNIRAAYYAPRVFISNSVMTTTSIHKSNDVTQFDWPCGECEIRIHGPLSRSSV